jgi:hypothetical protein
VTAAVRARTDPERVASVLVGILEDESAPVRERVRCAELIWAYLDGRPVTRSMSLTASADALPVGFFELPPEDRDRILDDVEARGASGALPDGDHHVDEE